MVWFAVYLTIAAAVTVITFVCAEWIRTDDVAAPDHPAVMSALAGVFWPFVVLGVTEAVLVGRITRASKSPAHQPLSLIR